MKVRVRRLPGRQADRRATWPGNKGRKFPRGRASCSTSWLAVSLAVLLSDRQDCCSWTGSTSSKPARSGHIKHKSCRPINHLILKLTNPLVGEEYPSETFRPQEEPGLSAFWVLPFCKGSFSLSVACTCAFLHPNQCLPSSTDSETLQISQGLLVAFQIFLLFNPLTGRENGHD